jgi:hypothetical protein
VQVYRTPGKDAVRLEGFCVFNDEFPWEPADLLAKGWPAFAYLLALMQAIRHSNNRQAKTFRAII